MIIAESSVQVLVLLSIQASPLTFDFKPSFTGVLRVPSVLFSAVCDTEDNPVSCHPQVSKYLHYPEHALT